MGFGDWMKKTFGSGKSDRASEPPPAVSDEQRAQAAQWLDAMKAGELNVPANVHDKAGWDTYWRNQVRYGARQQGLDDMMSSDPSLATLLDRRGARTVLCAGIGLSLEALSLALHGFEVTTLDVSEVPTVLMALRLSSDPIRLLPGFAIDEDGVIAMPELETQDHCPAIHRSPSRPTRAGGSLRMVIGDIVDPALCPGPFDAIIERRAIQLFPPGERAPALDRLAARLAPRCLFVSHHHNGAWRPDQPREHYATAWAAANGFVLHSKSAPDRLASLYYTTG